jgi:peroxiredoxin
MDELRRTQYSACKERNIGLVVVVPTTLEEAQNMVDSWALPYPLYADPDCTVFEEFDCGYMGPPLHGWIVLDEDCVVRYVFRTVETLELPLPMPSMAELVERAEATRSA